MLISVIVLATIMLGFAIVGAGTYGRELETLTALQNKKSALALATACAEHALQRFGRSRGYRGEETIEIGGSECTVRPIGSGPPWFIETLGRVGNQYARLRITLSSRTPLVITAWEEVPTFP